MDCDDVSEIDCSKCFECECIECEINGDACESIEVKCQKCFMFGCVKFPIGDPAYCELMWGGRRGKNGLW